jgi:hypothetical protein
MKNRALTLLIALFWLHSEPLQGCQQSVEPLISRQNPNYFCVNHFCNLEQVEWPEIVHKNQIEVIDLLKDRDALGRLGLTDSQQDKIGQAVSGYERALIDVLKTFRRSDGQIANKEFDKCRKNLFGVVEVIEQQRNERQLSEEIRDRSFVYATPSRYICRGGVTAFRDADFEFVALPRDSLIAFKAEFCQQYVEIANTALKNSVGALVRDMPDDFARSFAQSVLQEKKENVPCLAVLLSRMNAQKEKNVASEKNPFNRIVDGEVHWINDPLVLHRKSSGYFEAVTKSHLQRTVHPLSIMLLNKDLGKSTSLELTNAQRTGIGVAFDTYSKARLSLQYSSVGMKEQEKAEFERNLRRIGDAFNAEIKGHLLPEQWEELQCSAIRYEAYQNGLIAAVELHSERSEYSNRKAEISALAKRNSDDAINELVIGIDSIESKFLAIFKKNSVDSDVDKLLSAILKNGAIICVSEVDVHFLQNFK